VEKDQDPHGNGGHERGEYSVKRGWTRQGGGGSYSNHRDLFRGNFTQRKRGREGKQETSASLWGRANCQQVGGVERGKKQKGKGSSPRFYGRKEIPPFPKGPNSRQKKGKGGLSYAGKKRGKRGEHPWICEKKTGHSMVGSGLDSGGHQRSRRN